MAIWLDVVLHGLSKYQWPKCPKCIKNLTLKFNQSFFILLGHLYKFFSRVLSEKWIFAYNSDRRPEGVHNLKIWSEARVKNRIGLNLWSTDTPHIRRVLVLDTRQCPALIWRSYNTCRITQRSVLKNSFFLWFDTPSTLLRQTIDSSTVIMDASKINKNRKGFRSYIIVY